MEQFYNRFIDSVATDGKALQSAQYVQIIPFSQKPEQQAVPAGDCAEPCCASQSKNYSNLILKKDKSVNSLFKGFPRWK